MYIQIEIPDNLPEGRRSSFKKGILDALSEAVEKTGSKWTYTPEGHEIYRDQGKEVGKALNEMIQKAYPK